MVHGARTGIPTARNKYFKLLKINVSKVALICMVYEQDLRSGMGASEALTLRMTGTSRSSLSHPRCTACPKSLWIHNSAY